MVKCKVTGPLVAAGICALLASACGGGGEFAMSGAVMGCGAGVACVSTLAGSGENGNIDGAAQDAQFSMPYALALDAESNVHVADYANNHLTRIISKGRVSTPPEDPISFSFPAEVATDSSGNQYVADTYANRILKVTPAGETTVLAGTGQSGDTDGDASTATFSMPSGVILDSRGVLYVADMGNRKIRKITLT